MGTSLPRVDIPAKVDGSAMFGIDAQVPGMKYATLKASPVHGETVLHMNAAEARKMPAWSVFMKETITSPWLRTAIGKPSKHWTRSM